MWFFKLLLVGFSLLLALTIGESVVRMLFPVASQLYTFDKDRHYAYRPNSRKLHLRHPDNGADRFMIEINSLGYRGREFDLEKAPSQKRLVVFGDSFVAAEYSSLESSFCVQLEKQLGNPWQVVNAGVTGYGLDQSLLKMESELGELDADAVLVVICSENDSIDLVRNKLFELDGGGKLRRTAATLSESTRRKLNPPFALHPRNSLLAKTAMRAARSFRSAGNASADDDPEEVCRRFLARCDKQFEEFQVERKMEVDEVIEDFYDIDLALNPESEASRFKMKVTRAILNRMRQISTERGVPFAIVIVPSIRDAVEDYDDVFAKGLRRMPGYSAGGLTGNYATLAGAIFGSPSLNLYETFVNQGAEDLYFKAHDSHWNDSGQRFAAGLVADFFQQRVFVVAN